ncbi:MAG: D-aminoacyl-tRNA deacylase [Desulfobacterales bacterium]|nr:D-aminoacyl-tRNA deacylase [Desulfobacterales bacterium]
MRAVVQLVNKATVRVGGRTVGAIGRGLMVLLGVHAEDTAKDGTLLAGKIVNLRIFADDQGLMNRSLREVNGEMLVVSQFTLYGDCRKGRRPSYASAAPAELADTLYRFFVNEVKKRGIRTATGEFQAMMEVELVNCGPVTLMLDSRKGL